MKYLLLIFAVAHGGADGGASLRVKEISFASREECEIARRAVEGVRAFPKDNYFIGALYTRAICIQREPKGER